MASFKGSEIFSLDNKGRVSIPVKMRKCIPAEAESTFMISRGFDGCICAYPVNVWKENIEVNLDKLSPFYEAHRMMKRKMMPWCDEVTLDGAQKITLPKELLDYAKIDSKVMIIGMGDYIELWNPEVYEEYINKDERTYEEIAEQVMSGIIDNEKAKEAQ